MVHFSILDAKDNAVLYSTYNKNDYLDPSGKWMLSVQVWVCAILSRAFKVYCTFLLVFLLSLVSLLHFFEFLNICHDNFVLTEKCILGLNV